MLVELVPAYTRAISKVCHMWLRPAMKKSDFSIAYYDLFRARTTM